MPTVNREQFLNALESCQPGLDKKDHLDQSSCFIFHDGDIVTYNEELCCRIKSPLGSGITGAVPAERLVNIIRKRTEEVLDVSQEPGKIVMVGLNKNGGKNSKRSWVIMEQDLHIIKTIQVIEKPGVWKKPHPDFGEAVGTVQSCAGRDNNQFSITCVHVTPNWVEATDTSMMCRWTFENGTGFDQPILVRKDAVKHIASLGMDECSETAAWVHFRNPRGLVLSCRRYTNAEDFPVLTRALNEIKGDELDLSGKGGLAEIVDRAKEFVSPQGEDNDHVMVELEPGKLRLTGQGPQGGHSEPKRVLWDGQKIKFFILPDLLIDLVKKHAKFSVSPQHLIVNAGSYRFITSLPQETNSVADSNNNSNSEESQ